MTLRRGQTLVGVGARAWKKVESAGSRRVGAESDPFWGAGAMDVERHLNAQEERSGFGGGCLVRWGRWNSDLDIE